MRKTALILTFFLFLFSWQLFSIIPAGAGARSLGLGYAGRAFSYDTNIIFNNPSLIYSIPYGITGYQYQNSFLAYKGFADTLSSVLDYNLSQFENLSSADKDIAFSQLEELFSSKAGMFGFTANLPAFMGRGYGIAYSVIDTSFINPIVPGDGFFDQSPGDVSNSDIQSLQMNFLGLHYKQLSLSYGFPLMKGIMFGVTLHYLNGQVTDFTSPITSSTFVPDNKARDYLKETWKLADTDFSKIVSDLALSIDVGRYFKGTVVLKNAGNPEIKTPSRTLSLEQRIIAALAFRPTEDWGIYIDADITKTDLYHNGGEFQPISLGIEKGFFKNTFFARVGMLNDLTDSHFWGSKSNAMYTFGIGFNMKNILVDAALAFKDDGTIKCIAISGFFLLK